MTKLTGPFIIERTYHEIASRRNARRSPRRKLRPLADNFGFAATPALQVLDGADGCAVEPQLPDRGVRQPWWSRPTTQESSLPEIALKLKDQGESLNWRDCGAPMTSRVRPGSRDALRTNLNSSSSIDNLGCKSRGSLAQVLTPSEVVDLAHELNKLRSQSASSWQSASPRFSPRAYNDADSSPLSSRLKQLPKIKSTSIPAWDHCHDTAAVIASLSGLATRCAKCNLNFGDERQKEKEKTRFCRGCGDPRLENKAIGEVFFGYIGNKRTIIRKTDLAKLVGHIRYMHHKEESLTRQALHRLTLEINRFFDQVLKFQLEDEGNLHTHGLTMEHFTFFLGKIASSRSIAVKDLLIFLSEELHGQKHKEAADELSKASPEVPSHMSAVRALADQCPQCGHPCDGNHFCRKCGHKLKEMDGENPVGHDSGSKPVSVFAKKGRRTLDGVDADAMMALSSQYNLSLEEVRRRKEEFQAYDKGGKGTLNYPEFVGAVKHLTNNPEPPEHLLSYDTFRKIAQQSDKDGLCMCFEEFVIWSCNTEYSEEVLVTDTKERNLRQMARENGLCLPEVERIKAVFDKFDTDSSGFIDEDEFRQVMLVLMKVKNPSDLPQFKVRRCWREVDADHNGSVAFDEFLMWYYNFFDGQ